MIKLYDTEQEKYLNEHWYPTKHGKTWSSDSGFKNHLRIQFKLDRNDILRDRYLNTNELLRRKCQNLKVITIIMSDFDAETKQANMYDYLCEYIDDMTQRYINDKQNRSERSAANASFYQEQIEDLNKIRLLFQLQPI